MHSDSNQKRMRVTAKDHSLAAGRDIHVGDYYEYRGLYSESDPEWGEPPRGSDLIKCPDCRRAHFSKTAKACPRCNYAHRDVLEARARQAAAVENRRRGNHLVCVLGSIFAAILATADGIIPSQNLFPAVLAAAGVGHLLYPVLSQLHGMAKSHVRA